MLTVCQLAPNKEGAIMTNDKNISIEGATVSVELKRKEVEACLNQLEIFTVKEEDTLLENAVNFYRKNFCLSPKYAYVVFSRMEQHGISYNPSYFKVSLEKGVFKNDLRQMPTDKVHTFWSALDSGQKQAAIRAGHKMP